MKFPTKLPIQRVEDYHTHYLGSTSSGTLFWGYETFSFPQGHFGEAENDWQKLRQEYVVLHSFDNHGRYISTKHWSAGTTASSDSHLMTSTLEQWVTDLGAVEYHDIEIELFQTHIDGQLFGLVANEEAGMIELEPSSTIAFGEPWDGEYYT